MSPSSVRTRAIAPVMEVFASVQGEGAFVGEPQVFLRLRGCPLRCRWCDTPGSWSLAASASARLATAAGPRREPAWATPFQAACWIAEVEPGAARTVSVTGGEPLLWPDFLLGLRSVTGARRLHLETAGGHPAALERVVDAVDHVSLDLKLPADLDQPADLDAPADLERTVDHDQELGLDLPVELEGLGPFEPSPRDADAWAEARGRALALLRGRDACAKLVLAAGRRAEDYEELLLDMAHRAPGLPLYLQPVTPSGGVQAPSRALIESVVELAREHDLGVRVVPQVHRALGLP